MIEGTNQDAVREGFAELIGMAPQLTTPSRNHRELVDIWFEVQWTDHQPEWDDAFQRLANGRRPDPDTPSFFALFAHMASSGLIVARQVSADRAVWKKVEEETAALIAMVNAEVAALRAPPPARRMRSGGWSLRAREATAFLASLLWLGGQKPRLDAVPKLPINVSHGSSSTGR